MATPASMVERALEAFGAKAKVPPSVALLAGKDAMIPPIHLPYTPKDLCIPQEFMLSEFATSCHDKQECLTLRETSGSCCMLRRAVHA